MDNPVQLPEEIVTEILLKLPVKSILKFKTVCKSWNFIISETHFTNRHLKLSLSAPQNNFLCVCSHAQHQLYPLLLYTQDSDGTIRAKAFSIPYEHGCRSFCNSCDGLMCFFLVPDREHIFVWNPCLPTLVKIIPTLRLHDAKIALGHDPTSDDYKIVKVPSECSIQDMHVRVETFSFKTNSWKTMWFSVRKSVHYFIALVYAKNRVHWYATEHCKGDNKSCLIMYFDLVGESLELMNFPSPNLFLPTLMNYEDSIGISALSLNGYPKYWVLWVLEGYCRIKRSWKKIFRIKYSDWNIARYVGVTINGECFVNMREGGLKICDPKDSDFEDVIKRNHITPVKRCDCSFSSSPYIQSLLSLTQLH